MKFAKKSLHIPKYARTLGIGSAVYIGDVRFLISSTERPGFGPCLNSYPPPAMGPNDPNVVYGK